MATSTADGKDANSIPVEPSKKETDSRSSETHAAVKGELSPRLPHERDESSDSGVGPPREIMKQAAADIENGLVATDRSVETDELYARTLRGKVDTTNKTEPTEKPQPVPPGE